jgi:hypothetical protein
LSISEEDLLQVCSPLINVTIGETEPTKKIELFDETKIIDDYLGHTKDASDDSAYSSDSELISSNTLLADLDLAHLTSSSSSETVSCASSDRSLEQWDAIW